MRISIVGGGSIGLLFAYYLNQCHEVIVYTRTQSQADRLNKEGLSLKKHNILNKTTILSKPVSEYKDDNNDLTIVTVKQYQLPHLLEGISFAENQALLFLQNGMGHLSLMQSLNSNHIFVGSVEHGAYRESDVCVNHTGEGITKVAVFKGSNSTLLQMLEPLNDIFPFKLQENFEEMLVRKLVVNAVINPLTAILHVENGQLVESPYYFQLLNSLFNEVAEVLCLQNEKDYYDNLIHICKKTAHNRSSMLKDIEAQRPTEIDAILGFLVEKAKYTNKEAPLITAFYNCIKGKELKREGK